MVNFLIPIISAIAAGVLTPLLIEEYKNRKWAKPRKKLLMQMLTDHNGFRTLKRLTLVTGTSDDECRTLLIAIGARGAMLKSGKEGWALISKKPLSTNLAELAKESAED